MELPIRIVYPPSTSALVPYIHNYYELMVAQGEGRSPMRSSDAETDSEPIIIYHYY